MTSGRSLSLLAAIAALALAIAAALSIPSTANADPYGGPCVRITMVSADAAYQLHLVNENHTKLGLNNRQVGSSIVVKTPARIGILIDHTGEVKWEYQRLDNGQIGFEDDIDDDFNDAVIRVDPVSCPSRNSAPAPTPTPTATPLEVSFDDAAYTVQEGGSVTVTVNVSPDADRSLEIPVSVTNGSAESDDYSVSGLTGGKLSLASGESSASFTIEAVENSDSGAETLDLSFGDLPEGVSEGTKSTVRVTIEDPVSAVEVSFDEATYSVNEGSSVTVTVNVSPGADRSLEIPVSVTNGSAESDDYSVSGLTGGKLSLASGESSASFTIEAVENSDSGAETLDLSFGDLPEGVSEGTKSTVRVTIEDPVSAVEVSFDEATYSVNEGSSVTVTVNVSPGADRSLEIPVSVTNGSAESDDYSVPGLTGGKLSFISGDSSASFTISTVDDSDRDAETLDLSFGDLPEDVSEGTQATAQVNINDTTPAPRSNTGGRSGGGVGGGYKISVQQTNRPPVFREGANTQRSIAEDVSIQTNLGTPVSATDPDGDTLTYTLAGPDAASFSLNSANGQLATVVTLDYETKATHHLIMKVYDGRGGSDTTVVTVRVADVAEQQVFVEAPLPTAQPQLVETLAPEPIETPTPTPTATPVPSPTPEPTVPLWLFQSRWQGFTSIPTPTPTATPIPSPTATPEPAPMEEDPTATPDLVGDSQPTMFTQFQGGGPLGDFQSTNVKSSVSPLPEEERRLRIWPIILMAIGIAMMILSVGMLISGRKKFSRASLPGVGR